MTTHPIGTLFVGSLEPTLLRRPHRRVYPPIRRIPRPSEWGIGMTLCAAALAEYATAIVSVSDLRMTTGYSGGEVGTAKGQTIARTWTALFAGDDITQVSFVLDRATELLRSSSDPDVSTVRVAMVSAIQETLRERIEAKILASYGMDLSGFTNTGLKRLGPDAFADLRYRIEQIQLGADFLVFGFDPARPAEDIAASPHILRIHGNGEVESFDRVGFWAIGSGDTAAISSLFFHDYTYGLPIRQAIYRLCAAKFVAERAELGPGTAVLIMRADGQIYSVPTAPYRALWESVGRPRLPDAFDSLPLPVPMKPILPSPGPEVPEVRPQTTHDPSPQPPSPE